MEREGDPAARPAGSVPLRKVGGKWGEGSAEMEAKRRPPSSAAWGLAEGETSPRPPPPPPPARPALSGSDSAVTHAVGAPEELVRRLVLALKVYCPAVIWSLGRVTKSSAKETALGWLWGRGQRGERGRKALG